MHNCYKIACHSISLDGTDTPESSPLSLTSDQVVLRIFIQCIYRYICGFSYHSCDSSACI